MPANKFCHAQRRDEQHYWEALLRDAGIACETSGCFWVCGARHGCGEGLLWEGVLDGNRLVQMGVACLGDETGSDAECELGAVMLLDVEEASLMTGVKRVG
jgi:hypothetical protein